MTTIPTTDTYVKRLSVQQDTLALMRDAQDVMWAVKDLMWMTSVPLELAVVYILLMWKYSLYLMYTAYDRWDAQLLNPQRSVCGGISHKRTYRMQMILLNSVGSLIWLTGSALWFIVDILAEQGEEEVIFVSEVSTGLILIHVVAATWFALVRYYVMFREMCPDVYHYHLRLNEHLVRKQVSAIRHGLSVTDVVEATPYRRLSAKMYSLESYPLTKPVIQSISLHDETWSYGIPRRLPGMVYVPPGEPHQRSGTIRDTVQYLFTAHFYQFEDYYDFTSCWWVLKDIAWVFRAMRYQDSDCPFAIMACWCLGALFLGLLQIESLISFFIHKPLDSHGSQIITQLSLTFAIIANIVWGFGEVVMGVSFNDGVEQLDNPYRAAAAIISGAGLSIMALRVSYMVYQSRYY